MLFDIVHRARMNIGLATDQIGFDVVLLARVASGKEPFVQVQTHERRTHRPDGRGQQDELFSIDNEIVREIGVPEIE